MLCITVGKYDKELIIKELKKLPRIENPVLLITNTVNISVF